MTTREIAQPLRGIIVPMVTPLAAADQLDLPGLQRLVDHLVHGGVHGLFILGTCGEGPSLGHRLRHQLVDHVCRQVDGRIPILVGISDTSHAETLELADHAADAGADALVLAPPFYYPMEQSELLAYVRRTIRQVALPLVLYNVPALTKIAFEPQTVRQLMDEEHIVAFKDSSGNVEYFHEIRALTRQRPEWTLFMGPEHLLARSLELGGDGGVSGGANICPRLFVRLYQTAIAEEQGALAPLVEKANRLGQIYQLGGESASSVVKALKSALSILGICNDCVAEPLQQFQSAQRGQIEAVVRELGLVPKSAEHPTRLHC